MDNDNTTWLEDFTKRLGDVRIHDSAHAGELVRKLGARAFTVGRDIYVRPELVRPMTPEGQALLAHEMTHVAEQKGLGPTSMPLVVGPRHSAPAFGGHSAGASSAHSRGGGSPTSGGVAPVQRTTATTASASLTPSEASAQSAEATVLQLERNESHQGHKTPEALNPQDVADRVYDRIARDLILERERGVHTL